MIYLFNCAVLSKYIVETQDPPLGDCVVRIFRAMIHTWNFLFERWSSGATKHLTLSNIRDAVIYVLAEFVR